MIHISQAPTLTKVTRMHLRPVSNPGGVYCHHSVAVDDNNSFWGPSQSWHHCHAVMDDSDDETIISTC